MTISIETYEKTRTDFRDMQPLPARDNDTAHELFVRRAAESKFASARYSALHDNVTVEMQDIMDADMIDLTAADTIVHYSPLRKFDIFTFGDDGQTLQIAPLLRSDAERAGYTRAILLDCNEYPIDVIELRFDRICWAKRRTKTYRIQYHAYKRAIIGKWEYNLRVESSTTSQSVYMQFGLSASLKPKVHIAPVSQSRSLRVTYQGYRHIQTVVVPIA